jgi:hypothetical protein
LVHSSRIQLLFHQCGGFGVDPVKNHKQGTRHVKDSGDDRYQQFYSGDGGIILD